MDLDHLSDNRIPDLGNNLQIGPYLKRTKLFDDFCGELLTPDQSLKKVIIRLFPCIYNLSSSSTLKRIEIVHKKLLDVIFVQALLGIKKDPDTGFVFLVFEYYPYIPVSPVSLNSTAEDYYTKYLPSFLYKGLLCLLSMRMKGICHHDICPENIYFGHSLNEKVEFKLLNFTFATYKKDDNNNINHRVSIALRFHPFKEQLNYYDIDYYRTDLWDFAISVLSVINNGEINEILDQINSGISKDINWIKFLRNTHPYKKHCKAMKNLFINIFKYDGSIENLENLLQCDLFNVNF